MKNKLTLLIGIVPGILALSAPAQAATFGFGNIAGGDMVGDSYTSQGYQRKAE